MKHRGSGEAAAGSITLGVSKAGVSAPLKKAVTHVSDFWFPINEPLYRELQARVKKGGIDTDLKAVVSEIAGDFSLFTHCLRSLAKVIKEHEPDLEIPAAESPIALLEWAGFERLQKILAVEPGDISAHSLKGVTPVQRARLQEAILSATTAETLAEAHDVDADLAYSTGLFRQLGLALLSWNYPVVYQKAVAELSKGISLEVSLTQMFGFSPTLLAMSVVSSWGLPPSLFIALSDEDSPPGWSDSDEVAAIAKTLTRICRVGEALARANSPETYPTARADWDYAKGEIEEALGSDGITLIREKLAENCFAYVEKSVYVFTPGFILDPEVRIADHQTEELSQRNPFVTQCRPFLRQRLCAWYGSLRPGEISREQIQKLSKEIIPSAGFFDGCVYTVDPTSQHLIAQLMIGAGSIKKTRAILYSSENETAPDDEHQIVAAFKAHGPIVRSVVDDRGIPFVSIAGPLGFSQRVGVLYLGIRGASFSGDEAQHIVHFKALSQALNDSLGLR